MKFKILSCLLMAFATLSCSAQNEPENPAGKNLFEGKKVLVAYFSWGGTTRNVANTISDAVGADIFEIEPVIPYPTEYTPCTEVAREERDSNARPAIKGTIDNWSEYDIVFIGCPVWWHTAPMIISTFCEAYDFNGKIVVPFCTYAATYRDETLQKIVDLTPNAKHLDGFGSTGSTSGVQVWLDRINEGFASSVIASILISPAHTENALYTINGHRIDSHNNLHGIFIQATPNGYKKVIK